jgi:hypothetical protein
MSLVRSYSRYVSCTSMLAFLLPATIPAHADDTWHNVYHSLKRFFTGQPSSSQTAHHHTKHSESREKITRSAEPAASASESSASPDSSSTPRVIILPATSPTAGVTHGTENAVQAPAVPVKPVPSPDPSPELGPVLRSLAAPTPAPSPTVLPAATHRTESATSN